MIPAFQQDGGFDEDMAHRGDQRGEGHDKGGGAHCGFTVVAQHGGEDDQHHHTAARTEEACSESDGESEEQRNGDLLGGQLDLAVLFGALL